MHLLKPKVNNKHLIIGSHKFLKGFSDDELYHIKDSLTFKNPEYINVKKYSKWNSTRVPEYLSYYGYVQDTFFVPRGYKFQSDFRFEIEDGTITREVTYPKFNLELRTTQKEAADKYLKSNLDVADLNGIIQLPTGKGKSVLGLYLAYTLKQRTLIIVHKDDLVKGWNNDIDLCFNYSMRTGLIKAKHRDMGEQITIATIQTLSKLGIDELKSLYKMFGLIIVDELHHCPSTSYSVVTNFPARYRLGLTATPERADGLTHIMNLYFGGFAYRYKSIGVDKDILPVKVINKVCSNIYCDPVCHKMTSNSGVKYSVVSFDTPKGKKLSESEIRLSEIPYEKRPKVSYLTLDNYVVLSKNYMEKVLDDIIDEYSLGRSCVAFFTQKEHINIYFDKLVERVGVDNVSKFYGDNKTNDLTIMVAEGKRKHITLSTYAKGTEGTNVKQWEVEFLVSSINNEKNTEQVAGRIRRTKSGKINPVLLYDYSFPNVWGLKNHYATRRARYWKLKFDILNPETKGKLFKRGF